MIKPESQVVYEILGTHKDNTGKILLDVYGPLLGHLIEKPSDPNTFFQVYKNEILATIDRKSLIFTTEVL